MAEKNESQKIIEQARQLKLGMNDEEFARYLELEMRYGAITEESNDEHTAMMKKLATERGHKWFLD